MESLELLLSDIADSITELNQRLLAIEKQQAAILKAVNKGEKLNGK